MTLAIYLLSGSTLLMAGMLFTLFGDNFQTRLTGNIVAIIGVFHFLATFGVLQ